MPAGRPTDYTDEVQVRAEAYLESCKDTEVQQTVGLSVKGTELYKIKLNVNLPTIEGLSAYLRVNRDTLYEWAKHHPVFSDTLEDIKAEQAKRLMNSGLSGDYNPTIAKLMLSSNHGMSERTDITSGGKDLIPDKQSKEKADEALNAFLNGSNTKNTQRGESEGTTSPI